MNIDEYLEDRFTFTEALDEADEETRMKVRAVCQQADVVNKNQRLYPREVMDKALKSFKKKLGKRAFGEVDHPSLKARLSDTSHIMTALDWDSEDGSKLVGEFLILNTPSGKALREIIRAGGRPGVSSRGKGTEVKQKVN